MIRRSPCELYIKYLIIHPNKFSDADIRKILDYAALDYLGDYYIKRLRDEVVPPSYFYPYDKTHAPSQHFLFEHHLWKFFQRHPDFMSARTILENATLKELLETMLLSRASPASIALIVQRKVHVQLEQSAIEFYKQAFWNVDLLDNIEMRALLSLRYSKDEGNPDHDIDAQSKHLKRAYYVDPRMMASFLPHSPMASSLALMRSGILPTRVETARMLETIQSMSIARCMEALCQTDPETSTKAGNFINIARQATEILEHVVKPDAEMAEQLYAITLKNDESKIPLLADMQPVTPSLLETKK